MDVFTMRAFRDELEKLSAAAKQKKPKDSPGARMLGAVAAPVGTGAATTALRVPVMRQGITPSNLRAPQHVAGHEAKIRQMAGHMGVTDALDVDSPINVNFGEASTRGAAAMPGSFRPSKRHMVRVPVGAPESHAAHELGHIKNYQTLGRVSKRLGLGQRGNIAAPALSMISGSLGAKSGLATSAIAAGQKDPSYAPGAINAGIWAPRIADEAMASAHAVRHLAKRHGLGRGLLKSAPLAPAFGTYATMAAAPLAITAWRKRQQQRALQNV